MQARTLCCLFAVLSGTVWAESPPPNLEHPAQAFQLAEPQGVLLSGDPCRPPPGQATPAACAERVRLIDGGAVGAAGGSGTPVMLSPQPSATTVEPYYFFPALSGGVVDAETGQPIAGAVVNIAWPLTWRHGETPASLGELPRLEMVQLETDAEGRYAKEKSSEESFADWRLLENAPIVHVYAAGYQRLEASGFENTPPFLRDTRLSEEQRRATWILPPLRLQKSAGTEAATLEELRQWRRDLDSEVAAYNWPYNSSAGRATQAHLVALLEQRCQDFAETPGFAEACAPIPEYARKPKDMGILLDYIRYRHPARRYAARELGRQRSLRGLQFLVEKRELDLLPAYIDQYAHHNREEALLPGVEQLLITHYNDPQLGLPLLSLLAYSDVRYRERRLFDLMYAELAAGQARICNPNASCSNDGNSATPLEKISLAHRITKTLLPGTEAPLLELLPRLPLREQVAFFYFFAERGYAPAVPYMIQALQAQIEQSGAKAENLQATLLGILNRLATQEVADVMVAVLQKYLPVTQLPRPRPVEDLLYEISRLPPSLSLDWRIIKQAFPSPLDEQDVQRYFGFIAKWKIHEESPVLLDHIVSGSEETTLQAVKTLAGLGEAALCETARGALEKRPPPGDAQQGRYRYLQSTLQECQAVSVTTAREDKPADPLAYYRVPRFWLKQEPEAFVAAQRVYLAELEKVPQGAQAGLVTEVNMGGALGDIIRFRLRQPEQAIQEYQKLSRGATELSLTALLRIADTLRYDLKDPTRALDYYRQALARAQQPAETKPSPLGELALHSGEWRQAWLSHEIAYLEHGRTFDGPLLRQNIDLFGVAWLYGMVGAVVLPPVSLEYVVPSLQDDELLSGSKDYQDRAVALLTGLPPGTPVLLSSLMYLAGLEDPEKVLAYLHERDPAGFLSAHVFGVFATMDQASGRYAGQLERMSGERAVMKTAADLFLQRHGIPREQADSRFASPEQTWQEYLTALRRGDAGTALGCFSPALAEKLRFLRGLPADKLRAMADSFVAFEPAPDGGQERGEYMAVRERDGKKQFGFVHFVKDQGEWKIEEM